MCSGNNTGVDDSSDGGCSDGGCSDGAIRRKSNNNEENLFATTGIIDYVLVLRIFFSRPLFILFEKYKEE